MKPPRNASGRGDQRLGVAIMRGDRDRALEAMKAVETAVGAAAPGRGEEWRSTVVRAVGKLEAALAEQKATYEDPTSLMAQLAQDEPRVRTWVRQLQHRWRDLEAAARTLADELHTTGLEDAVSIADVREQSRWLVMALHHHRAREADLIYQALQIDVTDAHHEGVDAA